jgi:hypothetical protein
MVEFALVMPFMLLLISLMVDFGRLVYTYSAISNAAKEGARTLALVPQQDTDCLAIRRVELVGQGFPLVADPHSVYPNDEPNAAAANDPQGPSTPSGGHGYFYIWPAVAQSSPPDANGTSCQAPSSLSTRPLGSQVRDVEVQITYRFVPLTPTVAGFIKPFTIKTLSVVTTEY